MQEVFIGDVIKRRRRELGLTQEQLCEGICEPITISRLENGKQTPSRSRINALLERLDLPADRYFALLNKKELELEALQKEIVAYNVRFEQARGPQKAEMREAALAACRKLEAVMEDDDRLSRQLILRAQTLLGKEDGPYSPEEQRTMLLEAIRLTNAKFDPDEINRGLYTTDEIKIINQLAISYSNEGKHMEAIEILSQLYKYIRKHFQSIPQTKAHLNMVAFNYARQLDLVGQYKKAIEIAEEGRQACLKYGHYLFLPSLLELMAECHHFLGEDEISRKLYYQSYYLSMALEDDIGLRVVREEAWKYHQIKFET